METVQIQEAKARFSALVAAAEKGIPTLVSRHGHFRECTLHLRRFGDKSSI